MNQEFEIKQCAKTVVGLVCVNNAHPRMARYGGNKGKEERAENGSRSV